jgi:hypothetical protein
MKKDEGLPSCDWLQKGMCWIPPSNVAILEYIKSSSTNLLQANYKGKPLTNHWMPYYG